MGQVRERFLCVFLNVCGVQGNCAYCCILLLFFFLLFFFVFVVRVSRGSFVLANRFFCLNVKKNFILSNVHQDEWSAECGVSIFFSGLSIAKIGDAIVDLRD